MMTSTHFGKLAKIPNIVKSIQKPSLDILYGKLTKRAGLKNMDLGLFSEALDEIAMACLKEKDAESLSTVIEMITDFKL